MTKIDENIQTAQNMLSWIIERCYELEEENKKLNEEIENHKQNIMEDELEIIPKLEEENKKLKENIAWYEKEEDRLREENRKLREELSAYDREYFDEDKKAKNIYKSQKENILMWKIC